MYALPEKHIIFLYFPSLQIYFQYMLKVKMIIVLFAFNNCIFIVQRCI